MSCQNHCQITTHYWCLIIKWCLNKQAWFCNPLPGNLESLHVDLSTKAKKIRKNIFKRKIFEKKPKLSRRKCKLYNTQSIIQNRKTNNFWVGILAGISQCWKLLQLFCRSSGIFVFFLIYDRMFMFVDYKIFLHYSNMLNYTIIIFLFLSVTMQRLYRTQLIEIKKLAVN